MLMIDIFLVTALLVMLVGLIFLLALVLDLNRQVRRLERDLDQRRRNLLG